MGTSTSDRGRRGQRVEPHSVVLTTRITPTLKRALEREAIRQDRSEAWLIRKALATYLLAERTDEAMRSAA